MLFAAAADSKVSEARLENDMFTLPNTKKQRTLKASATTNCITNASSSFAVSPHLCIAACVKFVHSYNASVIRYGTTSSHTLPPTLICMLCSQATEARSGSHTSSKAFRRCTVRGLATPDADHNCPPRSCRRRDVEALQRARSFN